jgi:tol-pal system protein YbgF
MKRLIIPIALLLLGGCATQRDMDTLKFQVDTLQSRLAMTENKLAEKEKVLDQGLKQQGELLNKYSELQNQLFTMQGSIDQLSASAGLTPGGGGETRVALLEKDVQALKEVIQGKGSGAAGAQKSLYDSGMEKFKAGLYADALQDFKGYLAQNPDPVLSGDAYFYMGESLYALNRYDDAILSYDTVVKKFKGSTKVAESLYKEGLAFIKMGDKETGELIWKQLIKDHPDSEPAQKAKKSLKNPTAGKG